MKKFRILFFFSLAPLFYSCKSKKTLTFEQKYEQADKWYEKKKFAKAAEIYKDLYPEVPNKIENIIILGKLADCLYREKNFKNSFNDYKRLYETINDEERLMNGYRMANCLFNMLEKNNKRDISSADTLLEMIDEIFDEYEETKEEQEKKILEDLKIMRKSVFDKVIEKHLSIIYIYEKLEMFDSAVTYLKNFLSKYHDSKFFSEICRTLLKNQFLSATLFETKNKKKMTDEKENILFEKYKEIILTFENYKENLRGDKKSESFYEQALKKINLQK
ncbi:MAG: hypothetical protein LBD32_02600 [Cytophagales bacterium]|jgi:outer membrane protein assembly factor BamD|nr:hypothetical protein [Cytophagales bacterium]